MAFLIYAEPNFPGPANGGFNTQPLPETAPATISGHKAYVFDGKHFDSGCCFDHGKGLRHRTP